MLIALRAEDEEIGRVMYDKMSNEMKSDSMTLRAVAQCMLAFEQEKHSCQRHQQSPKK